ncbi:MAG: hypothetical protein OXI66_11130 [Boseongicola sp.]|nr:hypothetical protein [Boseongicola sp.]MDE0346313.1 hypothetical protein [Boseongicola sp.]
MSAARRVLTDTQVEPVALCVGGTMQIGSAAERASQTELARRRTEFCAELGIESLTKGMPGNGLVGNWAIRRAAEDAEFRGPVGIEIFSKRHWWQEALDEAVSGIVQRTSEFVCLDGSHCN